MSTLPADVQKALDEGCSQVVANVCGKDRTRGELNEYFTLVANADNWKSPIAATVTFPVNGLGEGMALVTEAVIFFTGSVPSYRLIDRPDGNVRMHVTADGYYAAIGA